MSFIRSVEQVQLFRPESPHEEPKKQAAGTDKKSMLRIY